MTHYEILEVSESCTYSELKKSYRRLVKLYHPDINPSPEAKLKILSITTAYDVLSDPDRRDLYDRTIYQQVVSPEEETETTSYVAPEPDPYEEARREYTRWKRKKEREVWDNKFKVLALFYKIQRFTCYLFLITGLVITYDYWMRSTHGPFVIDQVKLVYETASGRIGGYEFGSSKEFFFAFDSRRLTEGLLVRSGIFKLPVGIQLKSSTVYYLKQTFYWYHNFFGYVLILLSLAVLFQRKYSDFMLTIGILPFFILLIYALSILSANPMIRL